LAQVVQDNSTARDAAMKELSKDYAAACDEEKTRTARGRA